MPAKRKDLEHQEQVKVVQWSKRENKKNPDLGLDMLFAIPNGGLRHIKTRADLKLEGVKSGVPDLFLAVPNNCFSGAFIEMKIKPNSPTKNQVAFLKKAADLGYAITVSYSAEEAIDFIKHYLKMG